MRTNERRADGQVKTISFGEKKGHFSGIRAGRTNPSAKDFDVVTAFCFDVTCPTPHPPHPSMGTAVPDRLQATLLDWRSTTSHTHRATTSHTEPRATPSHSEPHTEPRATASHTLSHEPQRATTSQSETRATASHTEARATASHEPQRATVSHTEPHRATLSHEPMAVLYWSP